MSTSEYWDLTDPNKPLGIKDPDARLPFYLSWADWLEQEGAIYDTHDLFIDGVPAASVVSGLTLENDSFNSGNGVLTVWGVGGVTGSKYAITVRLTGHVGAQSIIDDRTVYIKIKER